MFIALQLLLFVSSVLSIVIGVIAWRANSIPGSKHFGILMFAAAEWALCDAISPFFSSIETKLFLSQLSYIGILLSPLHWTFFIFRFSGNQWISQPKVQIISNVLLLLFFAVVMSNNTHHWLYVSTEFSERHFCLTYNYGPFFWFWFGISYILLMMGTIRLSLLAARNETLIRKQVLLLMVAAFLPWSGNIIYILKLAPIPGFDATPISFSFVGVVCLIAIFRTRLFQLVPIAHAWLFRNFEEPLIITDHQGLILEANQKAKDLLRRDLNASINLKSIFISIDTRLVDLILSKNLPEETTIEVEWPYSENINWVEITVSRFQVNPKDPSLFIFHFKDISSFKKQNAKLESNADLLSTISLWADESMKSGWSESIHHLLPSILPRTTALATSVVQIENGNIKTHASFPANPALWSKLYGEFNFLRTSQSSKIRHQKNEENNLQIIAYPIQIDNKNWGFWNWIWPLDTNQDIWNNQSLKLAVDILTTSIIREKNLHEIIDSKNAAEKANNAKSEFLSIMSHEIRTPLNAIVGISSLLKDDLSLEERDKHIKLLDQSSRNLQRLVNDILDFNKIEAGKLQLEQLPISLRDMLNNVIEENVWKARENGNEIQLIFDEDIRDNYLSDELRINQILNNFVSNATKFTKNGRVIVTVKKLNDSAVDSTIRFSVKDNGIGIESNMLDHIFDSFTQAESSTTRRFGGTGLGLAISKQLLLLLQSEPKVKSTPGKGSEFYFDLVLEKSAVTEESTPENQSSARDFDDKKILLVEDNPINTIVTERFLDKWNLKYDLAQDGAEAVDKVKHSNYDLILMDLQMPKMDGREATQLIRQFNADVPIVALTASALFDNLEIALNAGMNDYLTKPFDPESLYQKLRKFL